MKLLSSSFRDPAGFLFIKDNELFRQVTEYYKKDYDLLMKSGLYNELVSERLLIPHKEINFTEPELNGCYRIIKPELIKFISYPYEWSFSQLKDTALTTLTIQKKALSYGMSLKDSSAYNIQFHNGKPVLIDTLSFEEYKEGTPWIAYRQFCQHFLAPLALMSIKDIRLNQLLRVYIDGIPVDLASSLLPRRSYLKTGLLFHIHAHARTQHSYSDKKVTTKKQKSFSKISFQGLIDNLEETVRSLTWKPGGTEWGEYYTEGILNKEYLEEKKHLVEKFINEIKPSSVWDMGGNTGEFSRIASAKGIPTVSFDIDPVCVERNYLEAKKNKETAILPLLLDLTNPSPSTGWENKERHSIIERSNADLVLALALIHHLAISNNLPLGKIAEFFYNICQWLIIEFVPKGDEKVKTLLQNREDIFKHYTKEDFEKEFSEFFIIEESFQVKHSDRVLYRMKKRGK